MNTDYKSRTSINNIRKIDMITVPKKIDNKSFLFIANRKTRTFQLFVKNGRNAIWDCVVVIAEMKSMGWKRA